MDTLIRIVCLLGVACSFITILLNINLVLKLVLNKSKRKDDMMLFYYRFVLDVLFGICLPPYIISSWLFMEYAEYMDKYHKLILIFAFPWSNLAACRSIIALSISTERFLSAYFPIAYRTGKVALPPRIILSLAISFGFSEELVLFGACAYDFVIPPTCRAFGCAVNQCFFSFWTIHKAVIFFIIGILSILLSIKLLVWKSVKKKSKTNSQFSKANRLALLGTITVLIFDFLPSFCSSIWSTAAIFNYELVGPYIGVSKVTGCAIEAVVVSSLLVFKESKKSNATTSSQQTRFWKNSLSSKNVITL